MKAILAWFQVLPVHVVVIDLNEEPSVLEELEQILSETLEKEE